MEWCKTVKKNTKIFDIDGTLVYYHSNQWLPGALEMLINASKESRIILITMRGDHDKDVPWSPQRTRETICKDLLDNGIEFDILFGVPSPRILTDDVWGMFREHPTNAPWN